MNVPKLGPAVIVLLAVALLLTASCNSAGGSSPGGTECTAEGVTCTTNADCEAITPGAACVRSACTCPP